MDNSTNVMLTAIGRQFKNMQYRNVKALAFRDLAKDAAKHGGQSEELARSMLLGVMRACGVESGHQYPICPRCGHRHP